MLKQLSAGRNASSSHDVRGVGGLTPEVKLEEQTPLANLPERTKAHADLLILAAFQVFGR
jgi:hypothetical protein